MPTTRLGLPYPDDADAADVPADVQALADAIDDAVVWTEGAIGARPAAALEGKLYFADDEAIVYVDTGAAWLPISLTDAFRAAIANATGGAATGANPLVTGGDERLMPTGAIMDFAGATAPSGWALCYGQELAIATYPALYAVLTAAGTTFPYGANTNGSGSAGSTHFRAPDLRGRTTVGLDNMGGSDASRLTSTNTLGIAGGAESYPLVVGNLPQHAHDGTITGGAHAHDATLSRHSHTTYVSLSNSFGFSGNTQTVYGSDGVLTNTSTTGAGTRVNTSHYHQYSGTVAVSLTGTFESSFATFYDLHAVNTGISVASAAHTHTFTGGNMTTGGTATAVSLMQPFITLNKIIKT